jgi:hypothetical protein
LVRIKHYLSSYRIGKYGTKLAELSAGGPLAYIPIAYRTLRDGEVLFGENIEVLARETDAQICRLPCAGRNIGGSGRFKSAKASIMAARVSLAFCRTSATESPSVINSGNSGQVTT